MPPDSTVNELAINLIFGRASDLYSCLYNQLFELFHYVFKFLTQ